MEEKEKSIEDEISELSESELSDLTEDKPGIASDECRQDPPADSDPGYIRDGDEDDKDADFGEVHVDTRSDEEIAEEDRKLRAQSIKTASNVGNFGMFLIIAVIFGYVIGRWMDGFFGTKPVFIIFWVCCGVAASILELVKNIQKAKNLGENKPPN